MSELSSKIFKNKWQFSSDLSLDRALVEIFFNDSIELIFPGMLRKFFKTEKELDLFLKKHLDDFKKILNLLKINPADLSSIVENYSKKIIPLSLEIEKDAKALLDGDPAATNLNEVLLCYPGPLAITAYRLAHFFYQLKIPILPRLLSELAHEKTGIDIHPGATIGESFFIDHGTGVVIGETAVIGHQVKIYQGVTLGALSVDKNLAAVKRHPTIQDHCVIYSHATILGGETIIGEYSIIGGNVWVTKSIPAHSIVYHKSEVKLDRAYNQQEELTYEI